MSENVSNYDSIVQQYEGAFLAFRRIHELRIPPPVRQIAAGSHWLLYIGIGTTVIASVIVSGSRTLPEFGGGLIGAAAFIMLEVGMVVYAFLRTKTDYDRAQHEGLKRRIEQALYLAVAIAITANIHHTAQTKIEGLEIAGIQIGAVVSLVIDLAIGFSAPALAFLAGDILGQQTAMQSYRQKQLDNDYDKAMAAWLEGLNSSWNSQKKKWGADIKVSNKSQLSIPDDSNGTERNGNDGKPALGHTKNSNAWNAVMDYYQANPDMVSEDPREIANRLNVGKSTVYKARAEFQSAMETPQPSTNGHH